MFQDTVIADSDDTVVVEGNHYFPEQSLRREHLRPSSTTSICPWKGKASYYTVAVGEAVNLDAAWTYPKPSFIARKIKGRVAFWNGVEVRPSRAAATDDAYNADVVVVDMDLRSVIFAAENRHRAEAEVIPAASHAAPGYVRAGVAM
ncbi:DUF427 domain-containing protein [Cumulibacter manganitolerans]|uniref:DUF427 domain-containing protein n=1 Tax=Cumulibacter manganitolerans TaxID=1884992 RepID=UPI00225DF5FF|nr:DUF427 domain-containing protein [Cumulibacter manganitolerans]